MGILRLVRRLARTRRDRWRALRRRLLGIPPVGAVDMGDLRRTTPFCDNFGTDRGLPIDRVYIEEFLERHAADVRGRVLEVKDNTYTRRFGGDRITQSDIVDLDPANPNATVIADLANAPEIADDTYDAVILTQTLQLIFDVRAVVASLHRILKPGGVLLLTVPGVSTIGTAGGVDASWCWSFTRLSLKRLLSDRFEKPDLTVTSYGNVLTAIGFLHGMAAEELEPAEFEAQDPDYPVTLAARAVKAATT